MSWLRRRSVEASEDEVGCTPFHTPRDRENLRRFNRWFAAATAAYLVALAAVTFRRAFPLGLAGLLVGVAALVAFQALRSYLVFLRLADELLRRIQTDALAAGFGAGVVFSLFYPLLERFGAPKAGSDLTGFLMLMAWSAGAWLGTRRYTGNPP